MCTLTVDHMENDLENLILIIISGDKSSRPHKEQLTVSTFISNTITLVPHYDNVDSMPSLDSIFHTIQVL